MAGLPTRGADQCRQRSRFGHRRSPQCAGTRMTARTLAAAPPRRPPPCRRTHRVAQDVGSHQGDSGAINRRARRIPLGSPDRGAVWRTFRHLSSLTANGPTGRRNRRGRRELRHAEQHPIGSAARKAARGMSLPTAPREIDLCTERSRPSCSISTGRADRRPLECPALERGGDHRVWAGHIRRLCRLLTPGGVHTGEATRRRQGRFYILYQSSRVKLMSGLVARRHVDLLRVIAMACPFLG